MRGVTLLVSSAFSCAALLVFIWTFYTPRWETNDDIAMAMVAHGFGLAAEASANIIFSNVLWGYLVSSLPSIGGVLGYSIGTVAVLFISGAGILFYLRRLSVAWPLAGGLTALILLRPAIFPQFTLNAGLLAVTALLALSWYIKSNAKPSLLIFSALSFLGFLIRSQEVIIVFLAALPFFNWKRLAKDRHFLCSLLLTVSLILIAMAVDWASYRGPAWQNFYEINQARAPYTDFGLADQLKTRPDIYGANGYTANDLDLLKSFFFSDPAIMRPTVLTAMASRLGLVSFAAANLGAGLQSVRLLLDANLLPLSLLVIALFVFKRDARVAVAALIVVGMAFLLGLIGRGGLERVFYPLILMLVLFSVTLSTSKDAEEETRPRHAGQRGWVQIVGILAAFLFSLATLDQQARAVGQHVRQMQAESKKYPDELLFSWGVGIPIEAIFPLFARDAELRKMRIYGMGVFTFAPFSRAYAEETSGRGFIPRIRSSEGLLMIAHDVHMQYLNTWCRERYGVQLGQELVYQGAQLQIRKLTCH